jgi:hypothetical protein
VQYKGRHSGMTAELTGIVKIAEGAGLNNHFHGCPFAHPVHRKQQFMLTFKRFIAVN